MEAASLPQGVTVLIADDHELFVDALAVILAIEPSITVVGHARDGQEAVELAGQLSPDVVLMDISMPVMDGFEATRRIRSERPCAVILMLTGSNSREDIERARDVGATGYVTKDRISADLVQSILDAGRA
jgi:two-component system nitrate/nitrite response regulator NarL